jgi:hypothetical protein
MAGAFCSCIISLRLTLGEASTGAGVPPLVGKDCLGALAPLTGALGRLGVLVTEVCAGDADFVVVGCGVCWSDASVNGSQRLAFTFCISVGGAAGSGCALGCTEINAKLLQRQP